jgi:hypothetical protein
MAEVVATIDGPLLRYAPPRSFHLRYDAPDREEAFRIYLDDIINRTRRGKPFWVAPRPVELPFVEDVIEMVGAHEMSCGRHGPPALNEAALAMISEALRRNRETGRIAVVVLEPYPL